MRTPDNNIDTNDNGLILEDMLTYDNLLEDLESDREFTIKVLSCSRVEGQVDEEGFNQDVIKVLVDFHKLNDIHHDPMYYITRSEMELRDELIEGTNKFFESKTNEEIVEYYRENEPYVFGMQNELEKLYAM